MSSSVKMQRLIEPGCIKLQGFNNLTKTLNFNLYDFCAARTAAERDSYVAYINRNFNRQCISRILQEIAEIIDARVLAVSTQDYQPWGASSLLLLSDANSAPAVHALHLDKSHICAHTYPDFRGKGQVCSFRIDINISTCGDISPLKALNYMFGAIESDVVVIDYFVRGFTRDEQGKHIYLDHRIDSIRDYIAAETLTNYRCQDYQVDNANIWQTKMLRVKMNEGSYFRDKVDLNAAITRKSLQLIRAEMEGVFLHTPH